MTQTVLDSSAFADALEKYYIEASDDYRKVVVGLQAESQQAEIYARYAHLYTTDQLESLASERDAASDPELREGLNRLWFDAAAAVAARDVVQAAQDLTNDRLGYRATWDGEEVSINTIGALIAAEEDFDRREGLYLLACEADEHFAARDLEPTVRATEIRSEVFGLNGEVAIAEASKGIDIAEFSRQVNLTATASADRYAAQVVATVPGMLGRDVTTPSRAHAAYMRSLHQFD
ncbi:MAG: hypothetical protein H7123_01005, partial [Thermoleophilia bacterium]|nr:hypothetical protein [Thermoleophilia bacterium]